VKAMTSYAQIKESQAQGGRGDLRVRGGSTPGVNPDLQSVGTQGRLEVDLGGEEVQVDEGGLGRRAR